MPTQAFERADDTVSAKRAVAVTPSDATVLSNTRALYIGTAGNLAVTMNDGVSATFSNVIGGTILPVQVTKVLSTGTTASNIVAMY